MSNQKVKGALTKTSDLPVIPEKLYFTIGEVGRLCQLKPHVLRYWEQEFPQLSPSKRRGNRRYYQRKDVLLVRKIRALLYEQGYTIEGARAQLLSEPQAASEMPLAPEDNKIYASINKAVSGLEQVLEDLQGV